MDAAVALYFILDRSELPYPTRTRAVFADIMYLCSTRLEVGD